MQVCITRSRLEQIELLCTYQPSTDADKSTSEPKLHYFHGPREPNLLPMRTPDLGRMPGLVVDSFGIRYKSLCRPEPLNLTDGWLRISYLAYCRSHLVSDLVWPLRGGGSYPEWGLELSGLFHKKPIRVCLIPDSRPYANIQSNGRAETWKHAVKKFETSPTQQILDSRCKLLVTTTDEICLGKYWKSSGVVYERYLTVNTVIFTSVFILFIQRWRISYLNLLLLFFLSSYLLLSCPLLFFLFMSLRPFLRSQGDDIAHSGCRRTCTLT